MTSSPSQHAAISTEKTRQIRAEQIKLLFAAMPLSLFATLTNALILVAVQWGALQHATLLAWLGAMLLSLVFRGSLTIAYRRQQPGVERSRRWARWFITGTVTTALVWGSTSLWLFPDDIGHQVFLAFVIAGMAAGASTSLSFLRAPIIAFLLILLVPLCIRFFLLDDTLSLAMGTMTLLFLVIVLVGSLKIYLNTYQNIALRLEASAREEQLRASEGKYHHIFDSAPLGIVHFDPRGCITDFNETFADQVGAEHADLLHLNLLEETRDPQLQATVHSALSGTPGRFEGKSSAFIANRDLDIRVFCGGIESREGMTLGGVAIVVDISEDKRIEKLKSEFISTVSHELRTPLTAIRGALGLLHGKVTGELPPKAHELLEIGQHNTERLLALINDILDIDKITAGKDNLYLQAVEVGAFLHRAVQVSESYSRQFNVQLNIQPCPEAPLWVQADPKRLMQILTNLISNATKFSPEGASVTVGARATAEQVIFSVHDSGPGIPEQFQQHIYERFTQADASDSRRIGGTGLGLSITRALVEKHGGHIHFETGSDGTTFYVELPRASTGQ